MWPCSLQCGGGTNAPYFQWTASNAIEGWLEARRKLQEHGIREGRFSCYYAGRSDQVSHYVNSWQATIHAKNTSNKKQITRTRVGELAAWLRVNYLRHSRRYEAAIKHGNLWTMGGRRFRFSALALLRIRLFLDELLQGWRELLLRFLPAIFVVEDVSLLPRPPLEQTPEIQPNAPAKA